MTPSVAYILLYLDICMMNDCLIAPYKAQIMCSKNVQFYTAYTFLPAY